MRSAPLYDGSNIHALAMLWLGLAAGRRHGLVSKLVLWQGIESHLDSSLPTWRDRVHGMGQLEALDKRSACQPWRDEQVFEALVMAVLSSNTDWSKIEEVRPELPELLCGFSLEWYAARSDADVTDLLLPWFKVRKAGSRVHRGRLTDLIGTAQRLLEYSRAHGAADDYFTSLVARCGGDPKRAALRLGCPGADKLRGLGVPLAAEALKNLGFDVAKPDRHIRRAIGSFGLVRFSRWSDTKDWAAPETASKKLMLATMAAVEEIAEDADERVTLVDNAIWLLCAKSGCHLTNRELAQIAHESESMGNQAQLDTLIQSWIDEDDPGEQRETLEGLVRALDEDRLSNRKLFPPALKGKSW